jgi:hypothetical protein
VVDLHLVGVGLGEGDALAAVGVVEGAGDHDAAAAFADLAQVAGEDVVALVAAVAVGVLPPGAEAVAFVAGSGALGPDAQPFEVAAGAVLAAARAGAAGGRGRGRVREAGVDLAAAGQQRGREAEAQRRTPPWHAITFRSRVITQYIPALPGF